MSAGPSYYTFAAGDELTIPIPVEEWDSEAGDWAAEDTEGGTWTAVILSADQKTTLTSVISCTEQSAGIVGFPLTALQTSTLNTGTTTLSLWVDLKRTDSGPRSYQRSIVCVTPARPS